MSERLGKVWVGFLTLVAGFCAAPALAQDFSAGKTAAQLFASDCAACHKSPGGLAKGQSVSALTSFLREHYTTKPASAAALAAYLSTPGLARMAAQPPTTGPKPGAEENPGQKPEAGAPAAPREGAKPPVDPVVAKLNAYAAARGEPKDTARLATPADKKKRDTNATGDTAAPHAPRPRRAQAPVVQPPPGNN